MRGIHLVLSGVAVAMISQQSCSNFADCTTRHDCPSDFASSAGSDDVNGDGDEGGASGASGAADDNGTDAEAGGGGAPMPACDGSSSPDVDACVISEEYGLFVSPTGDDATADGTRRHPYATVTTALANISRLKNVYVCAADYAEPAALTIPDRVSIYGGFTCSDGNWKYDASFPAHLLSKDPIGARITDAEVGVIIQDLRLDAANAPDDGTGASSFGLMISGSQNVALKRVVIRAGKGGNGKAGADGATAVDGIPSGAAQNGVAGTCTPSGTSVEGPHAVAAVCGSEGGTGGNAFKSSSYSAAQDGRSGYPSTPMNGGKGGDVPRTGAPGSPGLPGMNGEPGKSAAEVGVFAATGYKVGSGGNGMAGKAGQGGGGGGASLGTAMCVGATGGAGGMGGCGGDPGLGGTGGGASVALLSWQSKVSIDSSKLTALSGGAGGNGGKGHLGGEGKDGGLGGDSDIWATVAQAGPGGDGGFGGHGGNGAGGSGGPSVAMVFYGTAPMKTGTLSLNFASVPAAAGSGGTFGQPADHGPDGSKGLIQDVFPMP